MLTTTSPAATMRVPSSRRVAVASLVALAPFWSLYLAHALLGPNMPSGFIVADMPYYCANGREIFERGNGLMYCNPYDPDPAAPVIYFHLLPWIFGFSTKILGLDPGVVFVMAGAIGGFACAFVTYRIVETVLPDARCREACFFFVMWGGGLLVLPAFVANVASSMPFWYDILRFDPFQGWWFLSWGRNLVMPQEAVYHALVATAWLAVLRGRDWSAVVAVTTLALTHPFSGIQHLAVLGVWLSIRAVRVPDARPPLSCLVAVTGLFLAYYFVYLPSFPQHREVHGTWSLDWTLPVSGLVLGYLPVGSLATARCWRERRAWKPEMTFLAVAAAVSLLLVKHELFLPARQPLHFTRGYVWLPLALLGLPLVQRFWQWSTARPLHGARIAVAALLGGLAVLDDATFLVLFWNQPAARHTDVRIDPAMADAFRFLDRANAKGVVLVLKPDPSDWEDYNYLSATYTSLTPLVGHPWLTPQYAEMQAAAANWEVTGAVSAAVGRVDVMIVPRRFPTETLPGGRTAWRLIHANDRVVVLMRLRDSAATRSRGEQTKTSRLMRAVPHAASTIRRPPQHHQERSAISTWS